MKPENPKTKKKLLAFCIIIILIGGLGTGILATLTILPDEPATPGAGYPYSITFQVSIPEGERLMIGDLDVIALKTGDEMALKIGDHREVMKQGETREVADRTVMIQTLGTRVFQTGYRLSATWMSMQGSDAIFRVTLQTSRQVPECIISRVLPQQIRIVPV